MQRLITPRIHSSEVQPMRFRTFRESIRNMGGGWTGNDVYFAQTQSQYTAAFLPEYPEKSKRDSTISCCWLNGGWDYSGVYAEELRMKNGCVYRGCTLLSNGADDVETVHASDTVYQCGGACKSRLLRFCVYISTVYFGIQMLSSCTIGCQPISVPAVKIYAQDYPQVTAE